jgi:pimeloyl-ACP methyl ester carboxylesterase
MADRQTRVKPRLIMVHGAFCGGWAFDAFRQPFEADGWRCLAADLRGHGAGARPGDVAQVSMAEYAKDVAALITAEPTPPVLIGHSLGGLVAQMAATKAPVSALILLAPSAPWGVTGSSLEEAASAFGLYSLGAFWAQPVDPDRAVAQLYSLDKMSLAEEQAITRRMTPESGRALFETLNWWLDPFMTTQVEAQRIVAPVFVCAGGADLIHPPATVRQTAARLNADFRLFEGMSHWLIGEPGWAAVAAACLEWLATRPT